MKTYPEKRFFDWEEDDISVTLRNKSGSYGGGERGAYSNDRIIGALCARDYKGVGNEYVAEGKLVIQCREQQER